MQESPFERSQNSIPTLLYSCLNSISKNFHSHSECFTNAGNLPDDLKSTLYKCLDGNDQVLINLFSKKEEKDPFWPVFFTVFDSYFLSLVFFFFLIIFQKEEPKSTILHCLQLPKKDNKHQNFQKMLLSQTKVLSMFFSVFFSNSWLVLVLSFFLFVSFCFFFREP